MKTSPGLWLISMSLQLCSLFISAGCDSSRPLSNSAMDTHGTVASAGQEGAQQNMTLDGGLDHQQAQLDLGNVEYYTGGWSVIPAGSFMMGTSSSNYFQGHDETQHKVTLSTSFEISRTEVTQHQFATLLGYNPADFSTCGADCPVDNLTWDVAAAYCNKLSEVKGLSACYSCTGTTGDTRCVVSPGLESEQIYACEGYRLPTEAEWEYAYRAGSKTALYSGPFKNWGPDPDGDRIAWYLENSDGTTHPVEQKEPNDWGLYDMAGNVWEWVHDGYFWDLSSAPVVDPALTPDPDGSFIRRGGSMMSIRSMIRAASRDRCQKNTAFFTGVRCVRSLSSEVPSGG